MASNLKVDIVKPTATNGSLSLKGDSGGSATSNGISIDSSGNTSITGTTTIATADINGGNIDGTTIGANTRGDGYFALVNVTGTTTIATADINGGDIDGTTIGGATPADGSFTQVNADNIRLDGNTISSIDTNGDISISPNGTGSVIINSNIISPSLTGQISFFSGSSAPTGWLKANGAAISRTTYSSLFDIIGTTFGEGDGSTTFELPDLRGEFLRGWDDSRGIDSGRSFGSAQSDSFESHAHNANSNGESYIASTQSQVGNENVYIFKGDNLYKAINTDTSSTGGDETRPRNIALLACIKY